ncbi:LuxR family transcriptional regulator [Arthrobacter nitrophenolicus]|uniref:LuxR family transcriptional regulator n=1 Tax=Arthrobacter nitrophenolicus TaxID=683150 RepID=UPI00349B3438
MRTVAKTILLALLLMVVPGLAAGAASAAPAAPASSAAATVDAAVSSGGLLVPAGNTPTPSPGDTASSGPANPGTGESAENEGTRLNWAPLVIGAIAVVVLILILLWRRRRNTTIVG